MTTEQATGPLSVGQLAARAGVRLDTIRACFAALGTGL